MQKWVLGYFLFLALNTFPLLLKMGNNSDRSGERGTTTQPVAMEQPTFELYSFTAQQHKQTKAWNLNMATCGTRYI